MKSELKRLFSRAAGMLPKLHSRVGSPVYLILRSKGAKGELTSQNSGDGVGRIIGKHLEVSLKMCNFAAQIQKSRKCV